MYARKERQSQGMDITKLLCDNEIDPGKGPGVAQIMEGSSYSNHSIKPTNLDAGKTIPNAPNKNQLGQNQKEEYGRSRGGKHPSQEET
jgi:hypothetical protein